MLGAGEYLLTHVGFSREEKPILSLQSGNEFIPLLPIGQTLTLQFDTTARFCTGWYDMRAGESYPCPDGVQIEEKYDQCPACQQRTGFNPAFYHATTVSPQQEERNLQPHILYLAHFGKGVVKIGISHAARNRARLLEQGARSALILDTFPSAHIARQYEAKIAVLPGIAETLQLRKKISCLQQTYDEVAAHQELNDTKARIESILQATFSRSKPISFHDTYFPSGIGDLTSSIDTSSHDLVAGNIIGMLGPFLFCQYQDSIVFLPVKKYTGYKVNLQYAVVDIPLPSQQMSFF